MKTAQTYCTQAIAAAQDLLKYLKNINPPLQNVQSKHADNLSCRIISVWL